MGPREGGKRLEAGAAHVDDEADAAVAVALICEFLVVGRHRVQCLFDVAVDDILLKKKWGVGCGEPVQPAERCERASRMLGWVTECATSRASTHLGNVERVGLAHHRGELTVRNRVSIASGLDGDDNLLPDVGRFLGVGERSLGHLHLVVLWLHGTGRRTGLPRWWAESLGSLSGQRYRW